MDNMFEKTKAFCDSFLELGMPGFDLAVYHEGKCVLRYMNGYSDLENKIEMNGNERYNIYSCSKVITCVAAMQLWEKGMFDLEDRLSDYMPEFAEMTVKTEQGIKRSDKPILIRHLFEMTAGFGYDCRSPQLMAAISETDGKCPTREAMRYLAKEPLAFEPGERWEYSLCHDVLAALVEVLSGEKFEDYVKKNIFDVANMSHSTFMLPEEELNTVATQYRFKNGRAENMGKSIAPFKLGSEYASGGAGCISTVDDCIKLLEALRTYKLLKSETLKLMMTDRLTECQKRTYWIQSTHGYGLGVRCPKSNDLQGDFGWCGSACAYMAIDVENKISIYFGAHMRLSPAQGLRPMIYRFIRAEIINNSELDGVYEELREVHNYDWVY